MKLYITTLRLGNSNNSCCGFLLIDESDGSVVNEGFFPVDLTGITDLEGLKAQIETDGVFAINNSGGSITADDIIWAGLSKLTPEEAAVVKVSSKSLYSNSGQVSNGQVVFYLTDDKTSGGNALFSAVDLKAIQITVHKKTMACPAEAVSLSGITLTIDINKVVVALGILDVTQDAPDSTDVGVLVYGTPA